MSSDSQRWIELAVEAESEAVEAITELFARYGYNQGVVIEEPVQPGPDGGAVVDRSGMVKIRTYLPLEPENGSISDNSFSRRYRYAPQRRGASSLRRLESGVRPAGKGFALL